MFRHPDPQSLVGHSHGNGQCAGIAQACVKGLEPEPVRGSHPERYYPRVSDWVAGLRVKDHPLPVGTVIATFDKNGCYVGQHHFYHGGSGVAHTAIYMGQTKQGIEVIHQYMQHGNRIPAKKTLILFGGGKRGDACYADGYQKAGVSGSGRQVEDDANNYFVVELRKSTANLHPH